MRKNKKNMSDENKQGNEVNSIENENGVCVTVETAKTVEADRVVEDEEKTDVTGKDETAGSVAETTEKRERRASGTGSVYPLTNGKGFGYCIQLSNADKELKKKYGNKLRVLGTGKTYEDASEKARQAIENREELLRKKLERLGHKFEDNTEGGIENNPEEKTEG